MGDGVVVTIRLTVLREDLHFAVGLDEGARHRDNAAAGIDADAIRQPAAPGGSVFFDVMACRLAVGIDIEDLQDVGFITGGDGEVAGGAAHAGGYRGERSMAVGADVDDAGGDGVICPHSGIAADADDFQTEAFIGFNIAIEHGMEVNRLTKVATAEGFRPGAAAARIENVFAVGIEMDDAQDDVNIAFAGAVCHQFVVAAFAFFYAFRPFEADICRREGVADLHGAVFAAVAIIIGHAVVNAGRRIGGLGVIGGVADDAGLRIHDPAAVVGGDVGAACAAVTENNAGRIEGVIALRVGIIGEQVDFNTAARCGVNLVGIGDGMGSGIKGIDWRGELAFRAAQTVFAVAGINDAAIFDRVGANQNGETAVLRGLANASGQGAFPVIAVFSEGNGVRGVLLIGVTDGELFGIPGGHDDNTALIHARGEAGRGRRIGRGIGDAGIGAVDDIQCRALGIGENDAVRFARGILPVIGHSHGKGGALCVGGQGDALTAQGEEIVIAGADQLDVNAYRLRVCVVEAHGIGGAFAFVHVSIAA